MMAVKSQSMSIIVSPNLRLLTKPMVLPMVLSDLVGGGWGGLIGTQPE